jgi:hypothetical protein
VGSDLLISPPKRAKLAGNQQRGLDLGAECLLAGRDPNQKSVREDKLNGIAAAKTDAGKADSTQAAQFGWPNHFGFSSENTFNVLARALLLFAFRARLEFINASRHAFKTAKIASSSLEQMDNPRTVHRSGLAVYK